MQLFCWSLHFFSQQQLPHQSFSQENPAKQIKYIDVFHFRDGNEKSVFHLFLHQHVFSLAQLLNGLPGGDGILVTPLPKQLTEKTHIVYAETLPYFWNYVCLVKDWINTCNEAVGISIQSRSNPSITDSKQKIITGVERVRNGGHWAVQTDPSVRKTGTRITAV